MTVRIGINGFGRIGKLSFRSGWQRSAIQIAHVNDPVSDINGHAHLLEFDSIHGRWDHDIQAKEDALSIDGTQVTFSSERDPAQIDWRGAGVDLVLECSGKFKTEEALEGHFSAGARKVLVSAPCPEPALNLVMGINQDSYDAKKHKIISGASCTTNCLAPLVKVMNDSVGIVHGSITTIHAVTNGQTILDRPHKDLRRARACNESLIPTTTGSAKAIVSIFPELSGRLDGLAVRVPVANPSLTDFVFEAARDTTAEEVNRLFAAAADGPLKGVLGVEYKPLVSIDYRGDSRSSVVDALSTMVINQRQVKILSWYDNEWAYITRLVELAEMIAGTM